MNLKKIAQNILQVQVKFWLKIQFTVNIEFFLNEIIQRFAVSESAVRIGNRHNKIKPFYSRSLTEEETPFLSRTLWIYAT